LFFEIKGEAFLDGIIYLLNFLVNSLCHLREKRWLEKKEVRKEMKGKKERGEIKNEGEKVKPEALEAFRNLFLQEKEEDNILTGR